jgi:hypothetical protein
MMMYTLPEVRQGDSFDAMFRRVDDTDTPINLTGANITAELLDAQGIPFFSFACTLLDQSVVANLGKVRLSATKAQTALWKVATHGMVIHHDNGAYRKSTKDIRLPVIKGGTV